MVEGDADNPEWEHQIQVPTQGGGGGGRRRGELTPAEDGMAPETASETGAS